MKINEELKNIIRDSGLPINDSMIYLLGIHFGYTSSYIPEILIAKISRLNIFENDQGSVKWNIPLFEDQITGFDWVSKWMDLFGNINKERRGSISSVKSRMKSFFITYTDVREQEIFKATEMYLKTVNEPKYLKKSEKFIFEGIGTTKISLLREWVEVYRGLVVNSVEERHSKSVIMK